MLSVLAHPGIVRYVAHGETAEGDPAIVMEWVEGEDLAHKLRRGMPIDEVLGVVKQVAGALDHAHRAGVVHRDVKPGNVMLEKGDPQRAKLVDFGLARPMTNPIDRPERRITDGEASAAGFMVGTPQYMAPEQVRGEPDLDARTDLFALGCFLFKCLAGRGPFQAPDARGVLTRVLFDEPTPLSEARPGIAPHLESLVMWMLEKDRTKRPASGEDVRRALEALDGERVIVPSRLPVLTEREQRLVCFVLAAEPEGEAPVDSEQTLRRARGLADDAHAREMAELYGARLEVLADGSLAAAITGEGASATDQVSAAARLALALATHASSDVRVVLATGRAELGARPIGDGIDRAMALLRMPASSEGGVRIDSVTAGLLDASFVVADGVLSSKREGQTRVRTLLGKPTPCVGREDELAAMDRAFAECVSKRAPRAMLVTADVGMGKSRLRHEWTRAHASDALILTARGDPMAAGSPLGLVAELVRALAGVRRGEGRAAIRSRLRSRIARNLSTEDAERASLFLADLIGAGDPAETNLAIRAARLDPHIMNDQLERAWDALLAAESAAGPIVLVVEDLHWSDEGSIRFLAAALEQRGPIFVLALARPEVHDRFPELRRTFAFELALRPLAPEAARTLIEAVLGPDPGSLEDLIEHAAGNAFFLEELIRARAEGLPELPETVIAMVLSRFERLSPAARRVLRAAAVVGPVFWRGAVDAMLGESESAQLLDVDEALTELVRAELVAGRRRSHIAGEREWSFHQATVREAAYGMLTERDRVLGHALVAAWMESRSENDAVIVAEHYERGGKPARALPWWHRSAVQAMEGGDLRAAGAHVRRAMACGAAGEMLGALHLLEAATERWVGRYAEAARAGRQALRMFTPGSDSWYEALGEIAGDASALGDVPTIVVMRDAFLQQIDHFTPVRVVVLSQICGSLLLIRPELAEPLLEAATKVDESTLGDHPVALAYLARLHGLDALTRGHSVALFRSMKRASEVFHSAGDRRNACVHAANAGFAAGQIGAHAEAERLLQYAVQQARGLGILSLAKKNLARLRFVQGDHEIAARDALVAAGELAGHGHKRLESYARAYAAQALLAAGDLDAAEASARAAVECAAVFPGARSNAWASLSRVLLEKGDLSGALETALEAKRLFDELGAIEDGEALVRVAHAEALAAAGRSDESKAALRTALDRLEEAGVAIEPQWAAGYRRTPEIVWTVDLARRLGVPPGSLG
jgi:tetratricopeptide (TPR) repeat protein